MYLYKVWFHVWCIIKKLWLNIYFGKNIKFGKKVTWRRRFKVWIEGGRVIIGDNCFFNNDCSINSKDKITIGSGCIFGESVKLYDHNHIYSLKNELLKTQGYDCEEIIIGNNCWICSNVIILKGARIGNNCVIGAGAIIRGTISSDTVVYPDTKLVKKENDAVCEDAG